MSATSPLPTEATRDALQPVLGERLALKGRHLAVCLWLSLAFVFFNYLPLRSGEMWGHVRQGQTILQQGSLSQVDLQTPISAGMNQIESSWLSQAALAGVESIGGAAWLSNLHALVVTAMLVVLLRVFYLLSGRVSAALGLATLALAMAWTRLDVLRPELLGGLCLALLMWIVVRLEPWRSRAFGLTNQQQPQSDGFTWQVWVATPLLFVVWANLHASFAVGIVFLTCHLLGRVAHVGLTQRSLRTVLTDRQSGRWLLLTELALAATMLNPYGLDLLIETTRLAIGSELPWRPLRMVDVEGIAFVVAVGLLLLVWRHSRQKIAPTEVFLLATFGFLLAKAAGAIGWFAPVLALAAAPHACDLYNKLRPKRTKRDDSPAELTPRSFTFSLLCLLILWSAFALSPISQGVLSSKPRNPNQLYSRFTPRGVSAYLRAHPPQALVWAPREWSDWILWDGGPETQVFMTSDMRSAPRQARLDYQRVANVHSGWERTLDRYRAETLVIRKDLQRELAQAARESTKWRVVYEDAQGLVLKRAS